MKQLWSRQHSNLPAATIVGGIILLLFYTRTPQPTSLLKLDFMNARPRCYDLPGADQTVVVMKTGATEFVDKFPVHIKSTLTCYPNYMVVSDHEEIYQGVPIKNVLTSVSPKTRQTYAKDFQLFDRLQKGGRHFLTTTELSGSNSKDTGNGGHLDQPGWRLDKWKYVQDLSDAINDQADTVPLC